MGRYATAKGVDTAISAVTIGDVNRVICTYSSATGAVNIASNKVIRRGYQVPDIFNHFSLRIENKDTCICYYCRAVKCVKGEVCDIACDIKQGLRSEHTIF